MPQYHNKTALVSDVRWIASEVFDAVLAIEYPEDLALSKLLTPKSNLVEAGESAQIICRRVGLNDSKKQLIQVILDNWKVDMPLNGERYFEYVADSLAKICSTDQDWMQASDYLNNKTVLIFKRGNGSHQFIADLVPALITKGLVTSVDQLKTWLDYIVNQVESLKERNGAQLYAKLKLAAAMGEINTIAELYRWKPTI